MKPNRLSKTAAQKLISIILVVCFMAAMIPAFTLTALASIPVEQFYGNGLGNDDNDVYNADPFIATNDIWTNANGVHDIAVDSDGILYVLESYATEMKNGDETGWQFRAYADKESKQQRVKVFGTNGREIDQFYVDGGQLPAPYTTSETDEIAQIPTHIEVGYANGVECLFVLYTNADKVVCFTKDGTPIDQYDVNTSQYNPNRPENPYLYMVRSTQVYFESQQFNPGAIYYRDGYLYVTTNGDGMKIQKIDLDNGASSYIDLSGILGDPTYSLRYIADMVVRSGGDIVILAAINGYRVDGQDSAEMLVHFNANGTFKSVYGTGTHGGAGEKEGNCFYHTLDCDSQGRLYSQSPGNDANLLMVDLETQRVYFSDLSNDYVHTGTPIYVAIGPDDRFYAWGAQRARGVRATPAGPFNSANFRQYAWEVSYTYVTFAAEQIGGAAGAADSTGIALTFSEDMTGLTADKITIIGDTGSAAKGALSGSGTTYVIGLSKVSKEGTVKVSIADFGEFKITNNPQSVDIYSDGLNLETQYTAHRSTNEPDFWPNVGRGIEVKAGQKYELEVQYKATDEFTVFLFMGDWGVQTDIAIDESYGNYSEDKWDLYHLGTFWPGDEHLDAGKPLDSLLMPITGDAWATRKYAFSIDVSADPAKELTLVFADEGGAGGGDVWINYFCLREIDQSGAPIGNNLIENGDFSAQGDLWGGGIPYWWQCEEVKAPAAPKYAKYIKMEMQYVAVRDGQTDPTDGWANAATNKIELKSGKKYEIEILYRSTYKFVLFPFADGWGIQTGMNFDAGYGDYAEDNSNIWTSVWNVPVDDPSNGEHIGKPLTCFLMSPTDDEWATRKYAIDVLADTSSFEMAIVDFIGSGEDGIYIGYVCVREMDQSGNPTGNNLLENGGFTNIVFDENDGVPGWGQGMGFSGFGKKHWFEVREMLAPEVLWYVYPGDELPPPEGPVVLTINGRTNMANNVLYGLGDIEAVFAVSSGHSGVNKIEVEYTIYDEYKNVVEPTASVTMDLPGSSAVNKSVTFTATKYGWFPLIYNVYNIDGGKRDLLTTKEIWISVTKEDPLTPKLASNNLNEFNSLLFAGMGFYRMNTSEIISGNGVNASALDNMYDFYVNEIIGAGYTGFLLFEAPSHCTQVMAEAVANKFKGLGLRIEMCNEPDISSGLNVAQYCQLIKNMSDWIKAIDPSAILIGPGPVSLFNNNGLGYIRQCFTYMKNNYGRVIWDELSFHDYEGNETLTPETWKNIGIEVHKLLDEYELPDMPIVISEHGFRNKWWAGYEGGISLDVNNQMISELLRQNLIEADGVKPGYYSYHYALEHGYEAYASYFIGNAGQGAMPLALASRNRAQQLRFSEPTEIFDFGATGNKLFAGSRYSVNGNDVLELFNMGEPVLSLTLAVSGGTDKLLVADHFGNESYVDIVGGEAMLNVPRTPIYVKASEGQTISVVPLDFGTNLASGIVPTYSAAAGLPNIPNSDLRKITNGILETNNPNAPGGSAMIVWNDEAVFPIYFTLDFGAETEMNKMIFYHYQPDNGYSEVYEFNVEYWDGNSWVLLQNIKNNVVESDLLNNMRNYHFHQWKDMRSLNVVNFNKTITTSQLRVTVLDTGYGWIVSENEFDWIWANWGRPPHKSLTIREIEVYNTDANVNPPPPDPPEPPEPPEPPKPPKPFDQSYPFAMSSNGNVLTNPSYSAAMLDAGATMVRIDVNFSGVRSGANTWNWSTLDQARALREVHPELNILPIMGYSTSWARGNDDANPIRGAEIMPAWDPENLYGNFVYEAVSRYKDVTKYWESWNEPDLAGFGFPTQNGADFFKYQKAFYLAAKEADPDCFVVFAGLSYASVEGYLNIHKQEGYFVPTAYPPEMSFFEDYLKECLKDPDAAANNYYFDIMNQHSYSRASDCYDYIEVNKKMMMDYLGEIKPIWITEMGAMVGSPGAFSCSMDEYCDYILQSFAWGSMAGVEKYFHFQLDNSNGHGLYDGMLGNPRPAFYTYRDVLVAEFADVKFSRQLYGNNGVLVNGYNLWKNTEEWRAGYDAFEFLNDEGTKRVVMAFADTINDIDVKIPATPGVETATLIDRHNVRQTITAVDGYYELTLAGTTNRAGWPLNDRPDLGEYENSIGGATIVIVEEIDVEIVATYTVTFDADNGDEPIYIEVIAGETVAEPSYPIKDGHEFLGWYDGDDRFDFDSPVMGDIALVAKWEPIATAPVSIGGAKFISIIETSKNSRVWALTFSYVITYSNNETDIVTKTIYLEGNNANLDGQYAFAEGDLAGYTLIYDIKGNGSNIKSFEIVKK